MKKIKVDYAAELKSEFDYWEHIKQFGASDPFWADGVNLNLVRNHIIYYKNLIEETEEPPYPEIYYRETPPEIDADYMARKDEILSAAKKAYKVLSTDHNYLYLLQKLPFLSEKQKAESSIVAVLRYVQNVQDAIDKGDYICMRRYRHLDSYAQSLADCAKRVRELPQEEIQLSLF